MLERSSQPHWSAPGTISVGRSRHNLGGALQGDHGDDHLNLIFTLFFLQMARTRACLRASVAPATTTTSNKPTRTERQLTEKYIYRLWRCVVERRVAVVRFEDKFHHGDEEDDGTYGGMQFQKRRYKWNAHCLFDCIWRDVPFVEKSTKSNEFSPKTNSETRILRYPFNENCFIVFEAVYINGEIKGDIGLFYEY